MVYHLRSVFAVLLSIVCSLAYGQTASFNISPAIGCAPEVVYFTNTSTGSITAYNWNFGNGATSVLKDPSTTYTTAGTYTVTLTVSFSGGGTATTTGLVYIYAKPTVNFGVNSASGCRPHTSTFVSSVTANAPGPISYLWSFGDGSQDTAANPVHVYTNSGTFNVSLTVTNGTGCATTVTRSALIKVFGNNPFTASPLTSCSAPMTVNFSTGAISGVTTNWIFGDGGTGIGNTLPHTYATPGSYTVSMVQFFPTANCYDTVTKPAYIKIHNNISTFSAPASACTNAFIGFTNTTASAGATVWDFGDGSLTSYGLTVSHAYSVAGTYTIRMITFVGGCPDTATRSILIHPRPMPVITMSPALPCPAPVTVNFSATGVPPGSTYNWSWASGGTSTSANPAKTYLTGGARDSVMVVVTSPAGCVGVAIKDSIELRDMILIKHIRPRPSEGCIPLTIYFDSVWLETAYPDSNLYPAAITSYTWNFGDGSPVATTSHAAHTYNVFGTYIATVTLTTANGCSISDTIHVHAGTKIPPSYYVISDSNCISAGVLLQNTTWPPAPWYSLSTTPFFGPPWVGHSSVYWTKVFAQGSNRLYMTTFNNGCRDTFSQVVRTYGTGAFYLYALLCPPSLGVRFSNLSIGATATLWDFGDGTTSTSAAASITHTYPALGTYTCRLTTFDAATGCTDTFIQTFTLTRPQSALSVSDTLLCFSKKVALVGSFSGNAIGYSWAIDNVNLRKKDTVRHLLLTLSPGYHTVTFRDTFLTLGTDTLTCVDSIRRVNHIFVSRPFAAFSGSPLLGCAPLPVTFTSSSTFTPGAPLTNLKWDYGDGGKDSGLLSQRIHTYANPGYYTVKLVVSDTNKCADSIIKPLLINVRKVQAAMSVNKTTACIGETLMFSGSSSGGAYPLKFLWSFGDGDTSTLDNPNHAYRAVGLYDVKLIVTDSVSGCTDTLKQPGYIRITRPKASFVTNDTFGICAPLISSFTSTSVNAVSYGWAFGDGNTSALQNPVNTYAAPGIYSAMLIVKDAAGCADTSPARKIVVLGYAGALTYTPLKGCEPLTVRFKALVTNAPSLVWDFSDGVTAKAVGDTISHTYLTRGAYVPKLIFSNNAGCTSSSIGLDTIKVDAVTAGFTTSPPCVNSFTTFFDTSSAIFQKPVLSTWTFEGGKVVTGNPANWVYPNTGKYMVKLIATNLLGCKDSIKKEIEVLPLPEITAVDDTVVCIPDAVMLDAQGGVSYTWSPGATLSCTACKNPLAAPTVPTAYIVTGTDANGCRNRDTMVVGIQQLTSFTTLDSGEICFGDAIRLHAAGATLYHWTPENTLDSPDTPDPLARPSKTTDYVITAREGSCLANSKKVRVTVNPLPVVDAGSDEKMVVGKSVLLQASGTGIHHLFWTPDSALSCATCYAPEAAPRATTVFKVSAFSSKGCIAYDSVTVHVICDGGQLFLPNTFSPNADGVNDYFYPRGEGFLSMVSFRIFSRWGELLFEKKNFQANEEQSGWSGTSKGNFLPPDIYVYTLVARCKSGEQVLVKGDVALMR